MKRLASLLLLTLVASVSAQTKVTPPKNKYTPEQDVEIGREAAAEVRREYPLIDDAQVKAYLDRLGDRLVAASPDDLNNPVFAYSFTPVNLKDINAFALPGGPMFVNRGMMEAASQEAEVAGVMAHELAHVKNRDMLITTIAAGIAGAIGYLPYLLMFGMGRSDDGEGRNPIAAIAVMLLAPIAAMLIQFAVSRQREFEADRVGAEILGRPMPLANALRRLDSLAHRIPMDIAPAAAPLAQVNPLAAHGGGMSRLFSTHPPIEERLAKLEAMSYAR